MYVVLCLPDTGDKEEILEWDQINMHQNTVVIHCKNKVVPAHTYILHIYNIIYKRS